MPVLEEDRLVRRLATGVGWLPRKEPAQNPRVNIRKAQTLKSSVQSSPCVDGRFDTGSAPERALPAGKSKNPRDATGLAVGGGDFEGRKVVVMAKPEPSR